MIKNRKEIKKGEAIQSKKPSFSISMGTFKNLSPQERADAERLIQRGDWELITSDDDIAFDYLIHLLVKDFIKDESLRRYVELRVKKYQKENSNGFELLIRKIREIIFDGTISREEWVQIIEQYYSRLKEV